MTDIWNGGCNREEAGSEGGKGRWDIGRVTAEKGNQCITATQKGCLFLNVAQKRWLSLLEDFLLVLGGRAMADWLSGASVLGLTGWNAHSVPVKGIYFLIDAVTTRPIQGQQHQ